jgi:solute carrier family 25 carnitine/acylcarnitine transporter 20/29
MLRKKKHKILTYFEIFTSGALAGLIGSLISSPIEHGKIRMQMQINIIAYTGSMQALYKIYKTYGIKGVYKGFLITQFR